MGQAGRRWGRLGGRGSGWEEVGKAGRTWARLGGRGEGSVNRSTHSAMPLKVCVRWTANLRTESKARWRNVWMELVMGVNGTFPRCSVLVRTQHRHACY